MAANQLIGTIVSIGAIEELTSKNGNTYKRRDLVLMLRRFDPNTGEPITDTENTPQLTFMGDKCFELDNYKPGQVVTVSFDIQGRKYTDGAGITKIINDIRPFRIELYQPRTYATPQVSQTQMSQSQSQQSYSPAPSAPQQTYQPPVQQAGFGQQGGYKPPF